MGRTTSALRRSIRHSSTTLSIRLSRYGTVRSTMRISRYAVTITLDPTLVQPLGHRPKQNYRPRPPRRGFYRTEHSYHSNTWYLRTIHIVRTAPPPLSWTTSVPRIAGICCGGVASPPEWHSRRTSSCAFGADLYHVLPYTKVLVHDVPEQYLGKSRTWGFVGHEAVGLQHAFRSVSVNVISGYPFRTSYDLPSRHGLGRYFL